MLLKTSKIVWSDKESSKESKRNPTRNQKGIKIGIKMPAIDATLLSLGFMVATLLVAIGSRVAG